MTKSTSNAIIKRLHPGLYEAEYVSGTVPYWSDTP